MTMSLRQTLPAIGKQPPIRIPGDVTMHGNSLREFLNPYWKFKSVDLRPIIGQMGLNIKQQIRGTCTIFASTFLLEYMVCKERQLGARTSPPWPDDQVRNSINLSEEYHNAVANIARKQTGNIEGNPDGENFWGCSLGYKEFGIVDEEWFPYKTAYDPNYIPDNELIEIGKAARFFKSDLMYSQKPASRPEYGQRGFSDQQISSIMEHLDNGIPVAVGFHGFDNISMVDWGDLKGIWDDTTDDSKLWGHSVAIVGYCAGPVLPSGGYFIFRNSWGEDFRDKGYGYFTFNYIRKFACDALLYDRAPKFLKGVTVVKEPFRGRLPQPLPNVIDNLKKLKN